MLRTPVLISSPQQLQVGRYELYLYFKDPALAKYLNIGDEIEDSTGNKYTVDSFLPPLQDGERIEVIPVAIDTLPQEDVDYDSFAYTPGQKDFYAEFQTYGQISHASIADPVNYEYYMQAFWDGSYEEYNATIGDRIVDSKGKEYEITFIDPVQRFNTYFRVSEVLRTGELPSVGPATLYRATKNIELYQGTGLRERAQERILGRDAAIIDDAIGEINQKVLPPGGRQGYVLTKLSDSDYDIDWQPNVGSGARSGFAIYDGGTFPEPVNGYFDGGTF